MNTNMSAAATIASEDEDYKHMEDVEEEEPERVRRYYTEKQRRSSAEKPKYRKSAWNDRRAEEKLRSVDFG